MTSNSWTGARDPDTNWTVIQILFVNHFYWDLWSICRQGTAFAQKICEKNNQLLQNVAYSDFLISYISLFFAIITSTKTILKKLFCFMEI